MKTVTFIAIEENGIRDGTYGWEAHVDGVKVVDEIRDTDLASGHLDPLWDALNINLKFDWE